MDEAPLWLVMGDKPGDNAQLLAIAEALGWPYEVRRMIPRQEFVYGKPEFKPSLYHLDMEKSDPLAGVDCRSPARHGGAVDSKTVRG